MTSVTHVCIQPAGNSLSAKPETECSKSCSRFSLRDKRGILSPLHVPLGISFRQDAIRQALMRQECGLTAYLVHQGKDYSAPSWLEDPDLASQGQKECLKDTARAGHRHRHNRDLSSPAPCGLFPRAVRAEALTRARTGSTCPSLKRVPTSALPNCSTNSFVSGTRVTRLQEKGRSR